MSIETHTDILIFSVDLNGPHISVDLYGSGFVGNVSYDISDPDCRRQALDILRRWRKSGCSLVYICDEQGRGRLIDMDTYVKLRSTE